MKHTWISNTKQIILAEIKSEKILLSVNFLMLNIFREIYILVLRISWAHLCTTDFLALQDYVSNVLCQADLYYVNTIIFIMNVIIQS